MARPPKYKPNEIQELVAKFTSYITKTGIPIIQEFCAQNGLSKDYLYDRPEFSELLKRCTTKKEAALERKSLNGEINVTQAIFSLKQLGWKDKTETENINKNVNQDVTNLTPEERRAVIDEFIGRRGK